MMVASYAWMKSAGSGSWLFGMMVVLGFLVGFSGCLRFRELLEVDIRSGKSEFGRERILCRVSFGYARAVEVR